MSRLQKKLNYQISKSLGSKMAIGHSKHADKLTDGNQNSIYSFATFEIYSKACQKFAEFGAAQGMRNIEEMRPLVNDYIQKMREDGKSAWTQKMSLSALGKLYGRSFFKEVETDRRPRADVIRSRETAQRDAHFSTKKNAELINFCEHTGLRRRELEHLHGQTVSWKDGQAYVHIGNGKGGKQRDVPILNNDQKTIERIENTRPTDLVWGKVHAAADVHSYRREYAQELYKSLARDVTELPRNEVYHCHGDAAGMWFDKQAMGQVSQALGHNRIDVIAQSYLI